MPSDGRDVARAYVAALDLLARRELSEAQTRQRLSRKGHQAEAIDAAVARLRDERALDDVRVAAAIARREASVRGRGPLHVRRRLEQAGIASDIARCAVDDAFGEVDGNALLEASLTKRLGGRQQIADRAEFSRLYRYLCGRGFEPDRVVAALKKHQGHSRAISREHDEKDVDGL